MKKLVAIFLLLQIISNNAFAEELTRIPGLITHYFHHSREHKDTGSFIDFLHKHYADHHQNDRHADGKHEEDSDCNLPFKHGSSSCPNQHSTVTVCVPSSLNTDYLFYHVKKSPFPVADDRIESLDMSSIWQPPKISE